MIYEAHVRGFTMKHPEVPEALRGSYAGLGHPAAIAHLKNLGVTAVELLPVHEFADDGFLEDKSLRNYWGYSTLGYFAPEQRYMSSRTPGGQVAEFKAMVKSLHAAGLEVILDVVYNHTCEGNQLGPTLSLRGIDNAGYYWLMPDARYYLDFTGTGNSLNASNPETARLIVDSLRYWVAAMHVDGFRFDLATTIGRGSHASFDRYAPIFQIINQDPVLSRVKLIAEPWDTGIGGYQVGSFPAPFAEWNGRYRDALRRYWKGDDNLASEIGYRLTGSADLYAGDRREPQASVNFLTAHDGFTLHDLVTYGGKHNEANGERGQDGADDNQSWNHGVEGETDDPNIIALRERQKRNLLATLFLSQGVPMLLGGDEIGRTQRGNNNAYCQDNEISWFDWTLDDRRRSLLDFTRRLIKLRQRHPALQRQRFFEGDFIWESDYKDLAWLRPDGEEMTPTDWQMPWISSLAFMVGGDALPAVDERGARLIDDGLLVLLNAHHEPITFKLPAEEGAGDWLVQLDTAEPDKAADAAAGREYKVEARSLVMLRRPLDEKTLREAATAPVRVAKKQAERRRRRAGVVIPAVLAAVEVGVGRRRDRRPGGVRRLGSGRRLLGRAALAGAGARGRRRQPLLTRLGLRARPGLPVARRVRGFHGRRRSRRTAACRAREARGSDRRGQRRLGRGARGEAGGAGPGVRALPARRVERQQRAGAAADRVHEGEPHLARRLRALPHLARRIQEELGRLAARRARAQRRTWSPPGASSGATTSCASSGRSGSSTSSGGARAATSLHAASTSWAICRSWSRSIRPTSGPTAACSGSTATWERHRKKRAAKARPRATMKDRIGACRSTTGPRWSVPTSAGCTIAPSGPARCSACTASTTRSGSTGPTTAAPTANRTASRRPTSRRSCGSARR